MRRNRNRDNNTRSTLQTSQIMNDLSWTVAFSFIVTTILLMILISNESVTKITEYTALQASVTWDSCMDGDRVPGESKADVDMWILAVINTPDGEINEILGFRTPDRKTPHFFLDRDDKGFNTFSSYRGIPAVDDEKIKEEINEEVIKSAKTYIPDGNYYINLNLYSASTELIMKSKICADVQVVLFKGYKGKEKIVCEFKHENNEAVELIENKQEITVCQFEIQDGAFVEGSNEDIIDYPFMDRVGY